MNLTEQQVSVFRQSGVLKIPKVFDADEIAALQAAYAELCTEHVAENIREKRGGAVRTAMGLHLRHSAFAALVRDARLVKPARQLLGTGALYVQQVKVNVKAAFDGEAWQWHYDFATHHHEDGVPQPLALNLHVLLDDVTEFNGPLHFIGGSQSAPAQQTFLDRETTSYDLWCVDREAVASLMHDGELIAGTGRAGDVLIFGDLMVHSSPPNMSPFDRRIFSLILNPVSNAYTREARPEWKHHRDLTPVKLTPHASN
jgi:ectoine hydroxylase